MKNPLRIALLTLAFATPMAANARSYGFAGPDPAQQQRQFDNQRPMMIPNDMRNQHTRQSAKCMNAYPDDHGNFTSCINSDRNTGGYNNTRPQFMPMPANDRY